MRAVLILMLVSCTKVACPNPLDDMALKRGVEELTSPAGKLGTDSTDPKASLIVVIESGGEELNDAALHALCDENPARRLRAGLVLQVLPQTNATLDRLARSEDPREWAWAMLAEEDSPRRRTPLDLSEPGDKHDARRILDRFAGELKRALTIPDQQLMHLKEEYVEAYRGQFLANLEKPGQHLRKLTARRADLTGDGRAEWCLMGTVEDGWTGTSFILVADVVTNSCCRAESLVDFGRPRSIEAYDVDGDGQPELVLSGDVIGGWVWERIRVYDSAYPGHREWTGRQVVVLKAPSATGVWFASGDAFNASGGKAEYLSRAFGSAFDIDRLEPNGATTQKLTIYTGVNLW